jgi:hypothetical protein
VRAYVARAEQVERLALQELGIQPVTIDVAGDAEMLAGRRWVMRRTL